MYEGGVIIGEICHVHGQRQGAARYDPGLSLEELHGFENLILMCRNHHRLVDGDESKYTADRLRQIKWDHELRAPSTSTSILINLDVESRLGKIRSLMPDLLDEMHENIANDESRLTREFIVLASSGQVFNGTKHRFFYFEDEHPLLLNKIDMLGEIGLVRVIDHLSSGRPIYRFEEDFVDYLQERSV